MGSNTSKAKRSTSYERRTRDTTRLPSIIPTIGSNTSTKGTPAPVRTKTVINPRVPQELVDEILDHLAAGSNFRALRACALVSKSWVPSCRRHLFHTARFTSRNTDRWFKAFPVPDESPAHYVRELRVRIVGSQCVPEEFFQYTQWFTNAEEISLLGLEGAPPLRTPSFWKLPQTITSLTINTDAVTLVQLRDIMAHLPSSDDLSLSGSPIPVDRSTLSGIGTTLRGRFGRKLQLRDNCVHKDVVDLLLGDPTGLRFTEVDICCRQECLLPTARLVQACDKTLVKLSYMITSHVGRDAFRRSFDFSSFPNLQEVDFGVHWVSGSLLWIPLAFSTLRHTTSPRLAVICLELARSPTAYRSTETLLQDLGDDLRRVADEVTRIEREFEGAVNLTVVRGLGFKEALDTLGILHQYALRAMEYPLMRERVYAEV